MMGSVAMRKTLSIALVGFMVLSLFGFFGGVVEEVEGSATYDSGNNTIYINGPSNDLFTVWSDIFNPSVFDLVAANTYETYANIQINQSADLTVNAGEILRFNTSLNITIMGTLTVNGVSGNIATFTSINATPLPGNWQGMIFNTSEASNSVIDYLNVSYATIGIFCDGSSPIISNSIVAMNSDNGIRCVSSSPQISETEFSSNGDGGPLDAGMYLIGSSPLFDNSSFTNNPNPDLLIQSNSHPVSLNSSFAIAAITDLNSNLTVKWYLEVYVEDDNSLLPVDGATIEIKDFFGNPIAGSPFTSNLQGIRSWIQVIEYVDSTSPTEFHTPHNISVTHPEYYDGYANPEPNIGSSMQVQVNLTMIRRDLTTNPENITFSPAGIPIAFEDLQVWAKIHNIEIDDAFDVRVIIEDDAPEGVSEIYNISFASIPGLSSDDAIKIWQPTPGYHTINVYVDPFNDIMEINSNPLILAEENNNASEVIFVNARPWVNITDPQETEEVTGPYQINGSAIDDHRDDVNGSNITRVEIRLEGYDWIEINPGFDLFFNFISGYWEWEYDWIDTTEWNTVPISDGNYKLQARAWDNFHFSYLYEVNITVNNTSLNDPPVAVINEPLNNSLWTVNETITFNGSLSWDPNNDTLVYVWDFGDGNSTIGNVTTHLYTQKGTYIVSLTVNDTLEEDVAYVTVEVDNTPPYAAVTSSTDTAYVNETIIFYGYNSSDEETPNGLIFYWDFDDTVDSDGDGSFTNDVDFMTTSPVENVTYFYTTDGSYVVTLNVSDGRVNSTATVSVQIDPNDPPTAFINQPTNGQAFDVNETIFFNGSISSDPNDENLTYFWDFGDGTNSSWINESTTTHFYNDTGSFPLGEYTITLSVRDDEGLEDSTIVTIRVNNFPPVANASSNVTTALTNQDINFDATDSYDPEGFGISSYLWDFNEGNTSTSDIVDHQFAKDGIYNVTLTVVDNLGANDTDWIIITILNRDPIIDSVIATPSSPKMNENVTINISASDDDGFIEKYQWEFGDGNDYSENTTFAGDTIFDGKTNYSYPSRSTYTVTITVWDDNGASSFTQIIIEIANSPPEVIITSPTQDAQVLSSVVIEGTASDSDGSVSMVEIKIDNDPWESALGTSSWSYTWDTTPYFNGQHTIYARAYDGEDYTDPLASVKVIVNNPKTSITVTEFLNPSSIEQGGEVEVSGDVKYNTGEPVVDADINITIMNEPGFWVTTTDSNGFYSVTITAPDDTGSYWIEVEAETSSFSDSTQERLSVQAPPTQPDLEITSSDILFGDQSPYSGDTLQITISVKNLGTAEAIDVVVNGYYGDPMGNGKPLSPEGSQTINSIAGGQTGFATFYWDTSNIVGQHDIYMIVDPGNSISESDEDNNRAFKTITILGRPDFTLDDSDIEFSIENPIVGDSITIFIKIHNDGSEMEYVTYEVYDGDPDSDGILIESGQVEIDIDNDEDIMVDWLVEEPGEHAIFVVLSTKSGVEESNENNNKAFATITVEKAEEDSKGLPSIIYVIIVLVIVVLIILFFLSKRGKGEEPTKDLPVAKVVGGKATVVETEEEEEKQTMMEGQGGVRL
jgi:PKD repeat protein